MCARAQFAFIFFLTPTFNHKSSQSSSHPKSQRGLHSNVDVASPTMADFSWNNNDDPFDPASFVDNEPPQCFCGKVATTIYPPQEPGPSPTRKPRERDYSPPESFLLNEFDFSTAHTDEDEAGPSFSSYAYQMPSSFRQSSRRAYRPPPEPSSKKPPTSAVVFECHFTTPQEGMVSPEVCTDCEDLLRLPNERELDSGFEMFKVMLASPVIKLVGLDLRSTHKRGKGLDEKKFLSQL